MSNTAPQAAVIYSVPVMKGKMGSCGRKRLLKEAKYVAHRYYVQVQSRPTYVLQNFKVLSTKKFLGNFQFSPFETMAAPKSLIIIFLDIDGVLLPFPDPSNVGNGRIFPNETLTALSTIMEEFLDDYQVEIVLSSTWRVQRSMRTEILDDFVAYGRGPLAAMKDDFYDITDPAMHTERQHEIYDWLTKTTTGHRHRASTDDDGTKKFAAWICLDDEELLHGDANALRKTYFEGHVVHCDSKIGLTEALAVEAIQLIRDQLS